LPVLRALQVLQALLVEGGSPASTLWAHGEVLQRAAETRKPAKAKAV